MKIILLTAALCLFLSPSYGEDLGPKEIEFLRKPAPEAVRLLPLSSRQKAELISHAGSKDAVLTGYCAGATTERILPWARRILSGAGATPASSEEMLEGNRAGAIHTALPESIARRRISVDLRGETLSKTARKLSDLLGIPVRLHSSLQDRDRASLRVSLHVKSLSSSAALRWLCRLNGLEYFLDGKGLVLSLPGQYVPPVTTRTYRLELLDTELSSYPGVNFGGIVEEKKKEGREEKEEEEEKESPYEEIAAFVRDYLANPPQTAFFKPSKVLLQEDKLVVTASETSHRRIQDFLNEFPSYRRAKKFESRCRHRVSWLLRGASLSQVANHVEHISGLPVIIIGRQNPRQVRFSLELTNAALWDAIQFACLKAGAVFSFEGNGSIVLTISDGGQPAVISEPGPGQAWYSSNQQPLAEVLARNASEAKKKLPGGRGPTADRISFASNAGPARRLAWLTDRFHIGRPSSSGQPAIESVPPEANGAPSLDRALMQPLEVNFKGTAFTQAMQRLAEQTDLNIIADAAALKLATRGGDPAVTLADKNVPASTVLQRILSPLHLHWRVLDEAIYITTAGGEAKVDLRYYSLSDLAGQPEDFPGIEFHLTRVPVRVPDAQSLIEYVQETLPAELRDTPVSVWPAWSRFAVVCAPAVHDHLASRIMNTRENRIIRHLRQRLTQPVSLFLEEADISRVLEFFRDVTGLNIVFLSNQEELLPRPVNLEVFQMESWEALRYACLSAGHTYSIEGNGTIVVR